MRKEYSTISHTADIGIRARGEDLAQAYINTARGMFSLITDIRKIKTVQMQEVEVTAPDREALLIEWLNELLYLFDTEMVLFRRFEIVNLTDISLQARCYGEKIDKSRHELRRGIKSATYHMLKIEEIHGEYRVTVILDV